MTEIDGFAEAMAQLLAGFEMTHSDMYLLLDQAVPGRHMLRVMHLPPSYSLGTESDSDSIGLLPESPGVRSGSSHSRPTSLPKTMSEPVGSSAARQDRIYHH